MILGSQKPGNVKYFLHKVAKTVEMLNMLHFWPFWPPPPPPISLKTFSMFNIFNISPVLSIKMFSFFAPPSILGNTKSTVKAGSWSTVKLPSRRSDNSTLFCQNPEEVAFEELAKRHSWRDTLTVSLVSLRSPRKHLTYSTFALFWTCCLHVEQIHLKHIGQKPLNTDSERRVNVLIKKKLENKGNVNYLKSPFPQTNSPTFLCLGKPGLRKRGKFLIMTLCDMYSISFGLNPGSKTILLIQNSHWPTPAEYV